MLQRLAIAAALAAASTAGLAQTVVGGAIIIETAVVHSGTVRASSFLSYVSGGDGVTGTTNGSSIAYDGVPDPAAPMNAADHRSPMSTRAASTIPASARTPTISRPSGVQPKLQPVHDHLG
jgi:predicted phage tail protein